MSFLLYGYIAEVSLGVTDRSHIADWLWWYSTVAYFFLSVLTISASALFTSGIKRDVVYKTAISSFIVTMWLFLYVLMLELMARPLIFY
jgi:CHASE2 domain-containing sensor protein